MQGRPLDAIPIIRLLDLPLADVIQHAADLAGCLDGDRRPLIELRSVSVHLRQRQNLGTQIADRGVAGIGPQQNVESARSPGSKRRTILAVI
jgi:hypothetical protein